MRGFRDLDNSGYRLAVCILQWIGSIKRCLSGVSGFFRPGHEPEHGFVG